MDRGDSFRPYISDCCCCTVDCLGQLKEAASARQQTKILEREKSQPYVVAYLEENAVGAEVLDLVIKNFGQTAGRNVRLSFEPILNRTAGESGDEAVELPEVISFLAPGQEWRTLFDFANVRSSRDDLPTIYKGAVTYQGIDAVEQRSDVVIDLNIYKSRIYAEILGIHHAARALHDISKNQKKWSELQGGLKVVSRDGDAKDARSVELAQRWKASHPIDGSTENSEESQ